MGQCIFAGGEAVQLVGLLLDSPSGVPIGECVSADVEVDVGGGGAAPQHRGRQQPPQGPVPRGVQPTSDVTLIVVLAARIL